MTGALIALIVIIFLTNGNNTSGDINLDFQKLLKDSKEISVTYYRTSAEYHKPISKQLSKSEIDLLKSLKFKPEKKGEVGFCECKWNPIFTIKRPFFKQNKIGIGCTLTIEGDACLPPGDHTLIPESKRALQKWLKEIGIDINQEDSANGVPRPISKLGAL